MIKPYYEAPGVTLFCGRCEDVLPELSLSVDAVIADLPYGSTQNPWDSVIPLQPLWAEYERLVSRSGALIFTATQPFTSVMVMSNPKWFKWADVWRKSHATGHLNCQKMPLRQHEDLLVFGAGAVTYNPQITMQASSLVRAPTRYGSSGCYGTYGDKIARTIDTSLTYPRSVIEIDSPNHGEKGLHPTQKPVSLMEYLIRTYTNPGDTILDNTMGSGTTGVAAVRLGRKFIGIELSPEYCSVATRRIQRELDQPAMFSAAELEPAPPATLELAL